MNDMYENYLKKIQEWIGKNWTKYNIECIYANNNEGLFLVKIDNDINLFRLFTSVGNSDIFLSVDETITNATDKEFHDALTLLKKFHEVTC